MPSQKSKSAELSKAVEAFFTCPKGHKLPHRRGKKGRCSPFDCCEAKGHAWAVVRAAERALVRETSAYAEETQRMRERQDVMRVWNEAHPLPQLPPPPKRVGTIQQYMKDRMDQVAAIALEMKIRKMMLDPSDAGLRQADDLLDRQGTVKNPQQVNSGKGPVLIVNLTQKDNPYEAQKRDQLPERASAAVVEAEYEEFDPARAGREGSGPEAQRDAGPASRGEEGASHPAPHRDVDEDSEDGDRGPSEGDAQDS